MNTDIITRNGHDMTTRDLADIGKAANQVAGQHVFENYRDRKAANTLRRHDADLTLFAKYLAEVGVEVGDLAHDPDAWHGVTWGLVAGFVQWQLRQGYAVASVNARLSAVKVYSRLALKAGTIDNNDYAAIRAVEGYSRTEAKRVNEAREAADLATRVSSKKAEAVELTEHQVQALKAQPSDTGQGRRDGLIMCLLLDHGLRVGELAGLTVTNFDLEAGELTFYRPKVDRIQTHRLTDDTLAAAKLYFEHDALAAGLLLRGSRKDGRLHGAGVTGRSLTIRVGTLGRRLGIDDLSAHDCRHTWATLAARHGTPVDRLMDAGGWSSTAMPMNYIGAAEIANEGVRLG